MGTKWKEGTGEERNISTRSVISVALAVGEPRASNS